MAKVEETRKPTEENKADKKNRAGFFKSVKAEMKKITWYPKKTTLINSVWIGIVLVVLAGITGLIDVGLSEALRALGSIWA